MIVTRNLTKYYGSLCAVSDLNLDIKGEIFGLLGPNGSGKTTTVLMLTTLLRPTSGDAYICGYHTTRSAAKVRSVISYVPQDMAVDIRLTGRENVQLFARLYGLARSKDRVDELLGLMGLSGRADDLVSTYSGGMRRRLELAQALVHEPSVLFLDEPTIGLDVAARRKIWGHIISLRKKGMTVFVTTHYMEEADHACNRVAIIDRGSVAAIGTPGSLKGELGKEIIVVRAEGDFDSFSTENATKIGCAGDEIVFSSDMGSDIVPILTKDLHAAGLTVRSVSVREPTLDDVFLQLVGQGDDRGPFDDRKFRMMLRRRG
ncbi:MAG: ATP-binding cassette domain-containing protein [Methanoregulaceae archaeon]|nr:ATP-binding cassette domain-containing protein [Methanoregulaceae archaeon]